MKNQIPIWYWTSRFCHPLQIEETSIDLTPDGHLVSFNHTIENNRPLPSIPHALALTLAQHFVEFDAGIPLSNWTLIDQGSNSQLPHRIDHYFTWEDKTISYHGAHKGAYLHIRQCCLFIWTLSSYSGGLVAQIQPVEILQPITGRNCQHLLHNLRSGDLLCLSLGFHGRTFTLAPGSGYRSGQCLDEPLESLNSLPQSIAAYTTTMSYQGYLVDVYVGACSQAINLFLQIFLLAGWRGFISFWRTRTKLPSKKSLAALA